ncbi:MAG: glycosyltransferase family 39 protein [Rhodobacteraceae bacterium]|nr:glycosyltransferase family 39 protein [Paracoccaceae bacterium]
MPATSGLSVPSVAPSDRRGWLAAALLIVLGVTALRVLLLAFDRVDLFVDEAQYWLWGRELAFGYYSKPPLIGWVIRATTTLAGSDAPFWVRLPAPLFHAATALILARIAAETAGRRAAVWVAAGFVTLPMVAVGSLLIATDTMMFPFLALSLWAWRRVLAGDGAALAALAGLSLGLGALAKYAALYYLGGAVLAALLLPGARPGWRAALVALAACLLVLSPNLIWNAVHGFPTFAHTADNIGWVVDPDDLRLSPAALAAFLASQLVIFGPLAVPLFVGLALDWRRRTGPDRVWLVVALPILALVSVQALLDHAYANWAAAAWLPATLLVFAWLAHRPRLGAATLVLNAVFCIVLPLATLAPAALTGPNGRPLLMRYLGRAAVSQRILAVARAAGATAIVAQDRSVLADLFYTGRGAGLPFYATPPADCGDEDCYTDHYEMTHPVPRQLPGDALYVGTAAPACASDAAPLAILTPTPETYLKAPLRLTRVPATCWATR